MARVGNNAFRIQRHLAIQVPYNVNFVRLAWHDGLVTATIGFDFNDGRSQLVAR